MKIKSIQFSKLLPTSSYLNERIGIEMELLEGESADEALQMARDFIKESHKKEYPELYKFNEVTLTVAETDLVKEIEAALTPEKLGMLKKHLTKNTKSYYMDRLKTLTTNFSNK